MGEKNWSFDVIDAAKFSGHYSSIALDQNGFPHITYTTRDSEDLKDPNVKIWLKYAH